MRTFVKIDLSGDVRTIKLDGEFTRLGAMRKIREGVGDLKFAKFVAIGYGDSEATMPAGWTTAAQPISTSLKD